MMSSNYTDSYKTDDNGQRWVKLEYAQTYADRLGKLEKRIKDVEKIARDLIDFELQEEFEDRLNQQIR